METTLYIDDTIFAPNGLLDKILDMSEEEKTIFLKTLEKESND